MLTTAQFFCCVILVVLSLPLRIIDVLLLKTLRYSLNLLLLLFSCATTSALLFPVPVSSGIQRLGTLLGSEQQIRKMLQIIEFQQLNAAPVLLALSLLVLVIRPISAALQTWEDRLKGPGKPRLAKQVLLGSLFDGSH